MKLHKKFTSWVDAFVEQNVTDEAKKACDKWLMGFSEDNKPCQTTRHNDNDVTSSPYYTYNKYSVKYDKQQLPSAQPYQQNKSSSRPSFTTPQQQPTNAE